MYSFLAEDEITESHLVNNYNLIHKGINVFEGGFLGKVAPCAQNKIIISYHIWVHGVNKKWFPAFTPSRPYPFEP